MELTSITPDAAGLKALAHPVRLRILGLLRTEGPATSTTLATRLGLNTGATSYHLRQLAQHGFIADDLARGNGRDRWWRAAHQSIATGPAEPADAEGQRNLDAFLQAAAVHHTEQLQRAMEERPLLPEEWRAATELSDWVVALTPTRARALVDALISVIEDTVEDESEEAAHFVLQLTAYPLPGRLGGEPA